jgi:hypothetical protein
MSKMLLLGAALALGVAGAASAQSGAGSSEPKARNAGPATVTPTVPRQAPSTTTGSGTSRPTPAAVKEMLEAKGYSRVTDVVEGPDGYTASATKDGAERQLLIDRQGNVSEKD